MQMNTKMLNHDIMVKEKKIERELEAVQETAAAHQEAVPGNEGACRSSPDEEGGAEYAG